MDNYKQVMDDIERMQYQNFRICFNNILLNPIMGKNYYDESKIKVK